MTQYPRWVVVGEVSCELLPPRRLSLRHTKIGKSCTLRLFTRGRPFTVGFHFGEELAGFPFRAELDRRAEGP